MIRCVDLRWQKEYMILVLQFLAIATVCHWLTCQRWDYEGIFIQVNKYVTLRFLSGLLISLHKERVWSRGPPWTQICVLFLLLNCNILFESLQIHSEVFREFYKGHPYFNLLDSTTNILLYVLRNISIPLKKILFSSWISKWTVDIHILLHKPCCMLIIHWSLVFIYSFCSFWLKKKNLHTMKWRS